MLGIKICGYGLSHGERAVSNVDLEEKLGVDDAWIQMKSGVKSRYYCVEKTNFDLAKEAAAQALETSGLTNKDIDLVLACSMSPEMLTPSLASRVAGYLGIEGSVMAIDLNAACTGFVHGITIAAAMLEANQATNILLVGAEKFSPLIEESKRGVAMLFGDASGAVVLTKDENRRFVSVSGLSPDDEVIITGRDEKIIKMHGQEVYRFAVDTVPRIVNELLDKAELKAEDVDWYICHQANGRIIRSVANHMGVDKSKFFVNIDRYANTSSASIPICLCEMKQQGMLKEGQKVVCAGFGAGLSYGAVLITI